MSLDKQRILSELGSVMNQLKSADCGCMGKLFSNQSPGQGAAMGSPLPTCGGCRRGCCHGHGFSSPCAGEPYSMGHSRNHTMNQPCMGQCNPPKLFADTYSYLNNNLMQPVVKEVYDDLKSISPGNTVMNNPLGNNLGLSGSSGEMFSQRGGTPNAVHNPNTMPSMSGANPSSMIAPMSQTQPQMNPGLGGMGPQIVNMIMKDSGIKPNSFQPISGQGAQPSDRMTNSPRSDGIVTDMGNMNKLGNMSGFSNPPTQYVSQQNMYSTETAQVNPVMTNMTTADHPQVASLHNSGIHTPAHMGISNPTVQQTSALNQTPYGQNNHGMQNMHPNANRMTANNQPQYGQHTQGIKKFNEMFPGVMQGGDLGFDPMAIAIQMNPANQQKAAMDTMQRLMNGGTASTRMETAENTAVMKPIMDATNTPVGSINPDQAAQGQQNVAYTNQIGNQQMMGQQQVPDQQNIPLSHAPQNSLEASGQQQLNNPVGGITKSHPNNVPQQQAYTAITGQPLFNQNQFQQYNSSFVDPNTGAISTIPSNQQSITDPNTIESAQKLATVGGPKTEVSKSQIISKEPIFPADTSRNRPMTYSKPQQRCFEYNTLGQPVEMLPAKMFHPPEPGLPQTLSPQPPTTKLRNDYTKYSNVKSTVSKTSLAGNKPAGRTSSRSQLQHIYNQYKGSQSFTQQSVKSPFQANTYSEGKLNVEPSHGNRVAQQAPVEKVGGDAAANNQVINNQTANKTEPGLQHIGDVRTEYKTREKSPAKALSSPVPARQAKLRNGLQDVVYTSYPSSAAWSFHGTNTYRSSPVGYRFRNLK